MRLLRALISNLTTLLLALLLAIVVWAVAIQANDPVEIRNLEIPVRVEGRAPDTSIIGQPPTAVLISIRGTVSALNEITMGDLSAVVDVSDLPFGDVEAPIDVQLGEAIAERIELLSVLPASTELRVEQIISRDIEIALQVRGEVARGHLLDEARVEPATVQVTGSAQRVEQISEGRVTVFLDNAREDITQARRPLFYDVQGNVLSVSGLTLDPTDVEMLIDIRELAGFAEKPISVEWIGEPAPGYRLLNINVEPTSVQVTGAPSTLENLRVTTEQIDISGLTVSETRRVSLNLPAGVSLVEVQPVVVSVEVEPILSSDVVQAQVEVRGLAEGTEAILDPQEVRVFLFGPLPVLDSLAADDVRVTVDLLGLELGEHVIEPIVTVAANDVEVRSTQPPAITALITEVVTSTNEVSTTTLSLPAQANTEAMFTGSSQPLLGLHTLTWPDFALAQKPLSVHQRAL